MYFFCLFNIIKSVTLSVCELMVMTLW